jgi:hypothetical protein
MDLLKRPPTRAQNHPNQGTAAETASSNAERGVEAHRRGGTPVFAHPRSRIAGAARPLPLLCCLGALVASPSEALEITPANEDLTLRWDNSLRYNLGWRTQAPSPSIAGNLNFDDGDRNFGKGHLVASRLDLLSEADLVWRKRLGARVSAAAWTDGAYGHLDNTSAATANTLIDGRPAPGRLSPYASRFAKGPSGELLDAFAFASMTLSNGTLVSVRAGRHVAYWGEGLLVSSAIHGVSYGQYPLDLWKALATPGAELKELYRPRNGLTVQVQPTSELSLVAQTFFDWEGTRYPESGSYLSVNDAYLRGADSLVAAPNVRLLRGSDGLPHRTGDYGVAARWSPAWLSGTAGLTLRRTADVQPQLAVTPATAALPVPCAAVGAAALPNGACYINPAAASPAQLAAGQIGRYQLFYGRGIDLVGVSLSRPLRDMSLGIELNHRHNMPLQSIPVAVLPPRLANPAAGQVSTTRLAALDGDTPAARGNTLHGIVTLTGNVEWAPLFDTAAWQLEAVWNRWLSVTQNPAAFKGSDAYRRGEDGTLAPLQPGHGRNEDAVTRDYVGLGFNLTPTWFNVWPSVNLSLPLAWSGGVSGNSAVVSGGNRGAGSYSVGVVADVRAAYTVALRYVGFYGKYSRSASGAMDVPNGTPAVLSDRGHVMLTFKTTL